MNAPPPTALAEAKLKTSGLTTADAKELGIEVLSAKQTAQLFPKGANGQPVTAPSLKLNYFDLDGKPLKSMYRVRVLDVVRSPLGGKFDKLRYLQPPNTPPHAYLPRTQDWRAIADDTSYAVLITEGELKAASAAKLGYACVGLGGVWSWRSSTLAWGFLPELEAFTWTKRDVYIVYDSDASTNPQVALATAALCQALAKRGALPHVVALPPAGDAKVGLDDFLVAHGTEPLDKLMAAASSDELARRLWEVNSTHAFIKDPPLVIDEIDQLKHRPDTFKGSIAANVWATKIVTLADGSRKAKAVSVAKEWIEWPHRRTYKGLTFAPGQDRVHQGKLNEWRGWAIEPRKGSIKPWTELLDRLLDGASPEARSWFERWCLYPIRYPGTKLLTAAAIWSLDQGIGKSLVGTTLSRVYGDYFIAISQRDLESQFNFWAAGKQLVMVDDVSAHENKLKADILKKFITEEDVNVNIKGLPQYKLPNVANLYLTSNRSNAFYIEDRDRRMFVHEVPQGNAPDFKWLDAYHAWLRAAGPSALLHYAQHEIDFGDFEHWRPPPTTEAKVEMIASVRSEAEAWLASLKQDPDHYLRQGALVYERDMFTPGELLALFEPTRKGASVTTITMGMHARHFFPRAPGSPLKPNGYSERFYVVRNAAKWAKASRTQAEEHVRKCREAEGVAKRGEF